jgi:hypothetical protein
VDDAKDGEVKREKVPMGDDFQISPKYKCSDWKKLELDDNHEKEWQVAINIVEDRVKGRIIDWVDKIYTCRFSGFAVIALDCALLETLHGLFKGKSEGDTKEVYTSFLQGKLTDTKTFSFDKDTAVSFYCNVRNGILHDTETRKGWIIEQTKPASSIVESIGDSFVLNRTKFHDALKSEFEQWLKKLRAGDLGLRGNMKTRMEELVKKHFDI